MGKKIDRFVLTTIFAAGLYLYFERAFQNHVLAVALALLSCITLIRLLASIGHWFENTAWKQKRILRKKSSGALMLLACMEEADAAQHIRSLLLSGYDWNAPFELELLHPAIQLSQASIFNAWRAHRNSEKLLICTTGKCTHEAKLFASSLKEPKIALIGGDTLALLIAEHPEECLFVESGRKKCRLRIAHIIHTIFNRRNVPRGLVFTLSMLIMFVFSGNICYLLASLFLLFAILVSLRKVNKPAKLF